MIIEVGQVVVVVGRCGVVIGIVHLFMSLCICYAY